MPTTQRQDVQRERQRPGCGRSRARRDCPYMIEMVSTKTLRARDPDHSASRKPSEIEVEPAAAQHVVAAVGG